MKVATPILCTAVEQRSFYQGLKIRENGWDLSTKNHQAVFFELDITDKIYTQHYN